MLKSNLKSLSKRNALLERLSFKWFKNSTRTSISKMISEVYADYHEYQDDKGYD